jgi:hypothetical protein
MVQPNVNVRCIDMSRMTDRVDMKSLTNAIMMDALKASETIPNMDATFFFHTSFVMMVHHLTEHNCFFCMSFVHDGITHKDLLVPFYAGQMTNEDIAVFMDLFKLKGQADGDIQVLLLFLQKYSTMRERDGWDHLAQDVEFVGPVQELDLCYLEYQLDVHVQDETLMGVMTTNGHHRTGKGILLEGAWK